MADDLSKRPAPAWLLDSDWIVMPTASRQKTAEPSQDPMLVVRNRADALYRAAIECCRQHDRAAKLSDTEEPELEHEHLDAICKLCDRALIELADLYSEAAANVIPGRDEEWWHKANALWHASREYDRRHAGADKLGKSVSAKLHPAAKLGSMQMEYELEASALLALRHAAASYLKTRPGLS